MVEHNEVNYMHSVVLVGFAFTIAVFIVAYLIVKSYKKHIRDKLCEEVERESEKLKRLESLNEEYSFHQIKKINNYTFYASSKIQFDEIDFDVVMKKQLMDNPQQIKDYYEKANENKILFAKYQSEVDRIVDMPVFKIAGKEKYARQIELIEKAAIEKMVLKPITESVIRYSKVYKNSSQKSSYRKSKTYTYEDLLLLENEEVLSSEMLKGRRFERSFITPSLRYSILQRDGFRCTLCGRSAADGIALEVEHIIPIVKGGRTEESNLRTLCLDCNKEESEKCGEKFLNQC